MKQVSSAPIGQPGLPAAEAVAEAALEDAPDTAVPDRHDLPRVGAGFIALYMLAYFGFNLVMLMPALFSLAYKVQLLDPTGKDASLGLVMGVPGIVGLLAGPIAGVFSDGTRLRWGRRRPWLIGGMLLSGIGALILAAAPTIAFMVVGWCVSALAVATISAGFNPILAEHVPESQRGKVGALGGVAAALAGVGATLLGSYLTGNMLMLFLLPVLVFAIGIVVFAFKIKDEPAPADAKTPSIKEVFKGFAFNPRRYPDFALVWIGKFFLQFGFTFFSTYQFYFLLQRLGYTAEEAGRQLAVVGGLSLLALMSFAVLGGFLSDRLGRRKPFIYLAAALIGGGLVTVATAADLLPYVVGGVMLSAGVGAFTSVDLAMATDLLPEKDKAGKYMSIYYLASGLPGTIASMVAPAIIAIGGGGNYSALFVAGAVLALGAAISTWRIQGVR
jgi:MFS family permease